MTHILIIDDEVDLLRVIADNLTFEGFQVHTATNGYDGVNMALSHPPDVIICDVMMPELDGHGVLLELRAHPECARIPFLFLTARAEYTDWRQGMRLGADDYLVKPINHRDLMDAIESRLQKVHQLDAAYDVQLHQLKNLLETQNARNQSMTRFLAMLAHDMKTYLAALNSSAQLVRLYGDRMTTERQHEHLGRIESSVQNMVTMLNDLLTVSRTQSGDLRLYVSDVDYVDLCKEVIHQLTPLSEQHALQLEIRPSLQRMVQLDARLIKQVLINLITNAIKYSPDADAVHVRVTVDDDQLAIHVQDKGIGIPQDDLVRLFHDFHRAGNVGNIPGTGIGLTIVQKIVELHHGYINVSSEEGVGSTFSVYLPVRQPVVNKATTT